MIIVFLENQPYFHTKDELLLLMDLIIHLLLMTNINEGKQAAMKMRSLKSYVVVDYKKQHLN